MIDESENGMFTSSILSNEEEKIDKENSSLNSNHTKKKKNKNASKPSLA